MVYKLYSILLQLNQPNVEASAHFSLSLSAVGNGRASARYYWRHTIIIKKDKRERPWVY